MATFSPLLGLLVDVPDPRREQGQLYKLPHVLLFSILPIVTGCNSYRGMVTFIDVHRHRLSAAFGPKWRRAPARTAIRYILEGLDPAAVRRCSAAMPRCCRQPMAMPGQGSIALDGKTLRSSFDNFHGRAAAQLLSAFATDTALVLAHVDIAEKSNEIPAAQALLAKPGVAAGAIVTLNAMHCRKSMSRSPHKPTSPGSSSSRTISRPCTSRSRRSPQPRCRSGPPTAVTRDAVAATGLSEKTMVDLGAWKHPDML